MSKSKLTEVQRSALAYLAEHQPEVWMVSWEDDVCSPYIGKRLAALGLVSRFQPGRVTAPMQLRITDAGRVALHAEMEKTS